MKFTLQATDPGSKARAGKLETPHGEILTPIFMPVGTSANVKAVHQQELKDIVKAQIILSNTYHLFIRPGMDVIRSAGGLHSFMNWDRPILTDSGGYQVFSLAANRKIKEEGVNFQSHIDGSRLSFTPENIMDIQRTIGADIIMAFDECTPYPCEYEYARKSMELTHRWLLRCKNRFESTEPLYPGFAEMDQTLFPIIQGSTYKDLRIRSAEYVASLDMEGNAIGGLSVGEPAEEMYAMAELVCGILPESKPRYLMGVGTPANILENIALGIDMFDCVMPTRNARNGMLFTANGIINIKNEKWKTDHSPIDPEFSPVHSKAYLRHLVSSGEILGSQIATLHNLSFYLWLVTEARNRILAGDFVSWKEKMVKNVSQRL